MSSSASRNAPNTACTSPHITLDAANTIMGQREGARTGAFCRFAGRSSPGLSAALPALRFDALSIFAYSWSRSLSELFSRLLANSEVVVPVHCVAGAGLCDRVAVVANRCCGQDVKLGA